MGSSRFRCQNKETNIEMKHENLDLRMEKMRIAITGENKS